MSRTTTSGRAASVLALLAAALATGNAWAAEFRPKDLAALLGDVPGNVLLARVAGDSAPDGPVSSVIHAVNDTGRQVIWKPRLQAPPRDPAAAEALCRPVGTANLLVLMEQPGGTWLVDAWRCAAGQGRHVGSTEEREPPRAIAFGVTTAILGGVAIGLAGVWSAGKWLDEVGCGFSRLDGADVECGADYTVPKTMAVLGAGAVVVGAAYFMMGKAALAREPVQTRVGVVVTAGGGGVLLRGSF